MNCWLSGRMTWAVLLLIAGAGCAVPRPKIAAQALPPRPEDNREREAWIESMHRAAPGVNWRKIERENRQRSVARLAEAAAKASAPSGVWRQRGPTNQTGRTWVTAVTGDGNTLLVGSGDQGGGLFSGTPESSGWAERANSLGAGVQELVVVPGAPESWVVVVDKYTVQPVSADSEVFVSTNQGFSWTRPNGLPPAPPCGFRITRLLREPGASRTVYLLLTTVPYCVPTPTYTLLRSDDGGLNFLSLVSGSYAGAPDIWMSRVAPGPLYLLTDTGFKSSSNHGVSFTLLSTIPGASGDTLRLAGSEAGAPSFYVLASDSSRNTGSLFASTDGGQTWNDRGLISRLTDDPYLNFGVITASISNPSLLMLGGIEAYRSTDSGVTFHPVNDWRDYDDDPAHKLHADVRLDCLFYRGAETFFADTDGGTYMSTDLGATFDNITQFGIINGEYYSTLTSKNDPNLIAAGSQDQGLQQSAPAPLSAMSFDILGGGDIGHLTSTAGDHNMLYAAGAGSSGSVAVLDRESPPHTVTYTPSYPLGNRPWMPFILADPTNANAFYLTGDTLFRAGLDAAGWHWTAMPQNFSGAQNDDYLTALAISHANPSYWYAASSQGRLWYSHNRGATWALSTSPGPEAQYLYGTTILCSPNLATTCYVGGSGYSGPAVYKTTDGGITWQAMGEGLPSTLVLGLAFDDPVKQNLYAAADAGAFVYDPAAAAWKSIVTEDGPLQDFWSVEGVPSLGAVRFGTYGKGIWDYLPPGGGGGGSDCTPGNSNLCLGGSRFKVEATWRTAAGSGTAGAVGLTTDTGYFWFFARTNVEVVVKVLDGCSFNNRYWVFAAGLTNVEVVLKVTDTHTGISKTYTNPINQSFVPVQDTDAFAACP